MTRLIFIFLFVFPFCANAQIGLSRDSIVSLETCNESLLKSDSARLHYVYDNINTFYYFDGETKCNYILKITPRNNLSKLKEYLQCHRFDYNPATSLYAKKDTKAELLYKGHFIYLKIYSDKGIPENINQP